MKTVLDGDLYQFMVPHILFLKGNDDKRKNKRIKLMFDHHFCFINKKNILHKNQLKRTRFYGLWIVHVTKKIKIKQNLQCSHETATEKHST